MTITRQASRFAVVGLFNTGVGVTVIFACYQWLGLGLVVSNAAGYAVGLALSYVLNGSWTFGKAMLKASAIAKYVMLFCLAFSASIAIIKALMSLSYPYWFAQLSGIVTYSVIAFTGMKYAIFTE